MVGRGRRQKGREEAKEAKNQTSIVGDHFLGKFGFLPPLPPLPPSDCLFLSATTITI